jgi:hypothetical protein
MAVTFQVYSEGACIRIEQFGDNNEVLRSLVIAKAQIRTVDVIKDFIVRLDIGEGPLKNIFVDYRTVTYPVADSVTDLRTMIANMLTSEINDGDAPSELTQQNIFNKVGDVANILATIRDRETDISQSSPSRTDESNPNVVYRGWHAAFGDPAVAEWAIERITRVSDEEIHEWAFGHKRQNNIWNNRTTFQYAPYDHELPVPAPLP